MVTEVEVKRTSLLQSGEVIVEGEVGESRKGDVEWR